MAVQTLTNPLKHWPAAADGVTVTPSGTAWTSSSYVELVASVSADSLLAAVISRTTSTNEHDVEIDIATGGAGSETVIATIRTRNGASLNAMGENAQLILPILVDAIASGARVSTRLRLSTISVNTYNISVSFYEKPQTGGSALTTTNAPKCIPAAAASISLTYSGSAWTNGSWAQLIASTSAAELLLAVVGQAGSSAETQIDIGTGGAGSETVITTVDVKNRFNRFFYIPLPTPLDNIGSGVRIAARQRSSASTTATVALVVVDK